VVLLLKRPEIVQANPVFGEGACLPAAAAIDEPHTLKAELLQIMNVPMQFTVHDCLDLAEFTYEHRLHHHDGWHGKALVFGKTCPKGSANLKAMLMVGHTTRVEALGVQGEAPSTKSTHVMGWVLSQKTLMTTHALGQPVADAIARKWHEWEATPSYPITGESE
jgi:hypothetical protein